MHPTRHETKLCREHTNNRYRNQYHRATHPTTRTIHTDNCCKLRHTLGYLHKRNSNASNQTRNQIVP